MFDFFKKNHWLLGVFQTPLIKCNAHLDWFKRKIWRIIFVVVDLLSLKLLIFRFIIMFFGTLRMHKVAHFFPNFSQGEHAHGPPPPPPNKNLVSVDIHTGVHTRFLQLTSWFFIKTLKNADQVYTYLMKLKLNTRIGRPFYGYRNKCFHFV